MSRIVALESNFLVPDGTFLVALLVVVALLVLLVLVGVVLLVRTRRGD